jgi:arabinofuranosyltransferase
MVSSDYGWLRPPVTGTVKQIQSATKSMPAKTTKKRAPKVPAWAEPAGLAAGLVALLALVYYFDFTQDDAYITFRYAANYAAGHGLVYNVGEHIEGYTNFLWTIFMVLGRLAGADLVFFSKILGTLCGLGTIVLCYFLGRHLTEGLPFPWRSFVPGLACIFLGLTLSFAYWTVSGLETAAFTFMVTASLYAYLRRSYLAVPAVVLATLLRPEGGLVWLFIVIAEIIHRRALNHYLLVLVSLYLVYLLPLAIFKYSYYGGLLPNPFYAKTSFQWEQVQNGLAYVGQYGFHYWGAGFFILPAIWGYWRAGRPMRLLMLFVLVYFLYIIIIGGDVLKVHRFFVPIMPLMVPLVLVGLVIAIPNRFYVICGMILLLSAQMLLPLDHVLTFHKNEKGLNRKLGHLMDNILAIDSSNFSVAVSTIGLVGYRLLDHKIIDLLGLTDSTIARHPEPPIEGMATTWRETRYNNRYVLSCQPNYILFSTGFKPSAPAERSLYLHSAFLRSYRSIGFYFGGNIHPIYRLIYPVTGEIRRDVDLKFVQFFNRSINELWDVKNYPLALAHNDSALAYSPNPPYAYVYYYRAIIYSKMNDQRHTMESLYRVIELDTMVYEAYLNLAQIEYNIGEIDSAQVYRDRVIKLVPWYKPRLDSLFSGL